MYFTLAGTNPLSSFISGEPSLSPPYYPPNGLWVPRETFPKALSPLSLLEFPAESIWLNSQLLRGTLERKTTTQKRSMEGKLLSIHYRYSRFADINIGASTGIWHCYLVKLTDMLKKTMQSIPENDLQGFWFQYSHIALSTHFSWRVESGRHEIGNHVNCNWN